MTELIHRPSPNHDSRNGTLVTALVLHYTGMPSATEALDRLCDATAKVSAHYVVDEDGSIYALVPESQRAWHAGISHWAGLDGLNAHSIGIEIVNPGHEFGYRPFPPTQMNAVEALCRAILGRHPTIPARNVVAHSDIAPTRKEDPGELFDWARLAAAGIGLWPSISAMDEASVAAARTEWRLPAQLHPNDSGNAVQILQRELAQLGYGIAQTGTYDATTTATVHAFQRHWRQMQVDGVWDVACQTRLEALLRMV